CLVPSNVHSNWYPITYFVLVHIRLDQLKLLVQAPHLFVIDRGTSVANTELVESGTFSNQDTESPRRDFGVKRALVLLSHAIEFGPTVSYQSGKNIEPPR